jgi:CBS-domain-containing membrane protein
MSDAFTDLPLSVESALSVREAAIAIRYHGVKYLPVVDDGRLVGLVAFREEPRGRRDPGLGQTDTTATAPRTPPGHTAATSSSGEDR